RPTTKKWRAVLTRITFPTSAGCRAGAALPTPAASATAASTTDAAPTAPPRPFTMRDGSAAQFRVRHPNGMRARPRRRGCPRVRAEKGEDRVDAPVLRRLGRQGQLAEDAADVGLHGLRAQKERLCDPAVGAALRQEREDLELAPRQVAERVVGSLGGDEL